MQNDRLMEIMASSRTYPMVSAATLLWGASKLYGGLMQVRRKLYEKQVLPSYLLPCPVVSIGNLSLGGTGKTPMVIHLARMISGMGHRVAIISRGYKGSAQNKGAVVCDGSTLRCDIAQSGDEPYLIAQLLGDIPVVVGKDRYRAGKRACKISHPEVILLDDAFQHLRLKRDLNLLLMDAGAPLGNSFVIPRGRLREPAGAIGAADAVVFTRSESIQSSSLKAVTGQYPGLPVFRSVHRTVIRGMADAGDPLPSLSHLQVGPAGLEDLKMFGFSGLADNPAFLDTIRRQRAQLVGERGYADHHDYSDREIDQIGQAAGLAGADYLVTTDKDYVRIAGKARFPKPVIVLGVEIEFPDDDSAWRRFIKESVGMMIHQRQEIQ